MQGSLNIKLIDAKQAKEIYQFTNIKRKLYRANGSHLVKLLAVYV